MSDFFDLHISRLKLMGLIIYEMHLAVTTAPGNLFVNLLKAIYCLGFIFNATSGTSQITSSSIPIGEQIDETNKLLLPQTFLQQYIKFKSVSGHETEAATFFMDVCTKSGLIIREFKSDQGNINFAASIYPLKWNKPNIIFLNHLDVIPAGDSSAWDADPYCGTIIDEEIYGRGSYDNKGVAAMQLFAIAKFVEISKIKELPFNITMLSVSCEETQCKGGAQFIAENHLQELNPYVLIGEGPPGIQGLIPTDHTIPVFGISVAHKRNVWLDLQLEVPVSGHGSVTPVMYANQEMIHALSKLIKYSEPLEFNDENISLLKKIGKKTKGLKGFVLRNPKLFKCLIKPGLKKQPEMLAMFKNTITVTGLSSSSFIPNVIPSKINCLLDCRLLPMTDEKEFVARIKKVLDNKAIDLKIVSQYPKTPITSMAHPVFHIMSQTIKEYYGNAEVVPLTMPNSNDSGFFRAKGVNCFDIVPVILSMKHIKCIHHQNESIPVSAVYRGIEVYEKFLDKIMKIHDEPYLTKADEILQLNTRSEN